MKNVLFIYDVSYAAVSNSEWVRKNVCHEVEMYSYK